MRKAFGYLRVSSQGQVEGDGFTRQRSAIEFYAKSNGIRIVRWFEEQGVSGTTELVDRPALQDMLVALMSNGIRIVLIEKLDRLARDLMVQETILADMQKRGFELVSVMEPDLCTNDPSRTLVRQIMGAVAQYDKTMIVLKTRAARQRIRAKGVRCEGRKPFGARTGEQEIVERMLALRGQKMNWEAIANTLNAESIKTRTGNQWFPNTVRRIVLAHS
jgi:DNA invertase Pin-like site-specific DNA recombinase